MQQISSPILLLSLFLVVACGKGDDDFPELKPCEDAPPGYQLTFNDGPDFYVWEIGSTSDSEETAWGIIYFGQHPDPKGRHSSTLWEGNLAGQPAFWSVWSDEGRQLSEALIDYRHDNKSIEITLHALVSSSTDVDLAVLRDWMGTASLCQRDLAD